MIDIKKPNGCPTPDRDCSECGKCRKAIDELNVRISLLEATVERMLKRRRELHPAFMVKPKLNEKEM